MLPQKEVLARLCSRVASHLLAFLPHLISIDPTDDEQASIALPRVACIGAQIRDARFSSIRSLRPPTI